MSWVEIIGVVMLVVLLIENAVLKLRNKDLKEMLEKQQQEENPEN